MDNDIKNLFKKIEGSADSYQEIHRNTMNEQVGQRWPLLRDVQLNMAKSVRLHPTAKFEQEMNQDMAEVLHRHLTQNQHQAENKVVTETVSERLGAQRSAEIFSGTNLFGQSPKKISQLIQPDPVRTTILTQESGDTPLQGLFNRLAQAQTPVPEHLLESSMNSFFKKIFKP